MSSTPDQTDPVIDVVLDADADSESSDAAETAEIVEVVEVVGAVDAVEVVPVDPDPQLLVAHDLALAALREITPEATIGEPAGYRVEADGVVSLRFANRLAGYPGWFWTVSLARVEDAEPTVLEVELLPGDGALLAPDWVPWAVRLADYHAAQAALAEAAHADDPEDDEHEDLEDVDDLDASDFDEDGSPILHAGDVDGVDIDELADAAHDDEDDSDDDSEDDDSEGDDADDEDSDEDDEDDDDFDDESDEDDSDEDDFDSEDDDSEDDDEGFDQDLDDDESDGEWSDDDDEDSERS
ncbi:DUF3027 domain-containing protein [Microbacterium sp. NPDC056569]|uniref:DUF3027 domain-containing protein n=1 Tax=Microbacterium sp. NPDC056569 TaxID=3345867 RepID=UPI00366C6870